MWVAAEDTADVAKGTQIPALPNGAVTFGDKGIIQWGNGQLFIQRMPEADVYRFVHDDLRVLPVVTDASGERKIGFAEAVSAAPARCSCARDRKGERGRRKGLVGLLVCRPT